MAGRKKQPISPKLAKLAEAAAKSDMAKNVPDRLPDEDDLEYIWFSCYCHMGLDRTLSKLVKDVLIPLEPVKPVTTNAYLTKIKKASLKNNWVTRAKIYDARRIISATDSLIYTQQAIDAKWLDKGEKTREVIQKSIDIALRIQTCSFKILDAIEPKLDELRERGTLLDIGRAVGILSDVAGVTQTIQQILKNCWEGKEYTEAIQQLQQEILLIEQQDLDNDTK